MAPVEALAKTMTLPASHAAIARIALAL